MFDYWISIVLLSTLGLWIYRHYTRTYSYWSNRGIPGPKVYYPFGYHLDKLFHQDDTLEHLWSARFPRLYGTYSALTPVLTITDPELVKQVLVKDFPCFVNRRVARQEDQSLFSAEDHHWKRLRSITSPSFSSAKLRAMIPLINKCLDQLVEFLDQKEVINPKEAIAGFGVNVSASTLFGTTINAHSDDPQAKSFVHHAARLFEQNRWRVFANLTLPFWLQTAVGLFHSLANDSMMFFYVTLMKILEERKKSGPGGSRVDFVHLLMTASADSESSPDLAKSAKTLTEPEVISQALLFFIAGFEATSGVQVGILFELVQHLDIQERLFEELDGIYREAPDPESLADQILTAPYLDAVFKETLRKYGNIRIERRVGAPVKLAGIPLDPGVRVEIPICVLHRNPDYFPEPHRFNPDRFLPENKHLLVPYSYIPFGDGPRNCVGMRFALQVVKLSIGRLVHEFRFAKTPDTPEKMTFKKGVPVLKPNDFYIKVSRR